MLEVSNLRLGFAAGTRVLAAADGLSFNVARGETFALLGESGCGKSVTALGLMRLLPAAGRVLGGSVRLGEEELLALPEAAMRAFRGRRVAMIFQEPATSLNPVMTVGEQIGEVLARHLDLRGEAAQARMLVLLQQVGIDKKISPHKLRHTYATNLLNAGAELVGIKALLGHESISTTQIDTKQTRQKGGGQEHHGHDGHDVGSARHRLGQTSIDFVSQQ